MKVALLGPLAARRRAVLKYANGKRQKNPSRANDRLEV